MAKASVKRSYVIEGVADELECAICNEDFKQPKYLQCMHTFCEGCLEELAKSSMMRGRTDLPCPLCRQDTPFPTEGISKGLKTNTMAARILEKIRGNAINSGGDNSSDVEIICQTHQGQVLNYMYYCRTCRQRVCCILDHHRPGHDVGKFQDVSIEKKKALEMIMTEARSMLEQCRVQTEHTVDMKRELQRSLERAKSELNKQFEALKTRIVSRCEAAFDTLEKVERTRNIAIKNREDEHKTQETCIQQLLDNVEYHLNSSDATLVEDTYSVIDEYAEALKKMRRTPAVLDSSLKFVEFQIAPASVAAANIEVGQVYDDTKWLIYARTKDKLQMTHVRGVDMFENGTIVVADNSGGLPGGVYVIDTVDVESCLLVDEHLQFLKSNKDFHTFADVKYFEIDGSPRDVVAVPVAHYDVKCSGCLQSPLIGSKFTCLECKDFHLCSECVNNNAHTYHAFATTKYPFQYVPVFGVVSDKCEMFQAVHGGLSVSKIIFLTRDQPLGDSHPEANDQPNLCSITRDPSLGQVFVSELSQSVIHQFAPTTSGHDLARIATIPTELKPLFTAVNRHRGQIAVSNWNSGRVDVINYIDGHTQYSITQKGNGQWIRPNGICFDGQNTLYVVHCDTIPHHGEVHCYSAIDGSYIGVAVTGLYLPYGISIESGKMAVADWYEVKMYKRKAVDGTPKLAME